MKFNVKFKCPNKSCGGENIEEVMGNATVSSVVSSLDFYFLGEEQPDVELNYLIHAINGGEVMGYRCVKCGDMISDCSSPEELKEWLEINKMLQDG